MKINKKTWIIAIVALVMLLAAFFIIKPKDKPEYNKNILQNSGFEQLSDSGMPMHWGTEAYIPTIGVSEYFVSEGKDGNAVNIVNNEANDARFMQRVKVLPNTVYCLKGDVKAYAEGGRGANLSIEGVYVFSESVYESDDWNTIYMYGRTGSKQTEITVFARLGGYSGESIGEAGFDNVELYAVDKVPEGELVQSWEIPETKAETPLDSDIGNPAWSWLLILMLIYCVFTYKVMKKAATRELKYIKNPIGIILLIALSALIRIIIALTVKGYSVDIGCFTAWANHMASVGPSSFYLTEMYADYPPGYMLILWPIGEIGRLLGMGATEFMVKLPPIISDLFIVYIIYKLSCKKGFSETKSLALSALYAFNPVSIIIGSAWGQVDSVLTLFILLVVIFAAKGKWSVALPLYMLSVLIKPQALMFGPLGLVAFIWDIYKNRDTRAKEAIKGLIYALIAAVVVILPFQVEQEGIGWLIELYKDTMTLYSGITVNATNLYHIFGLNWLPADNAASLAIRLIAPLGIILPTAFYIYREKDIIKEYENKKTLIVTLAAAFIPLAVIIFAPVTLLHTGYLMMGSSFIIITALYIRKNDINWLPFFGALILIMFSTYGAMMHERYMFPAIVLLILFALRFRDKRLLALILLLSLVLFMNVGIVLDRSIRIGGAEGHLHAPHFNILSDSVFAEYINSIIWVFTAGFTLYIGFIFSEKNAVAVGFNIDKHEETQKVSSDEYYLSSLNKKSRIPRLDKKDVAIIICVTLIYGIVALADLGSTSAPQNPFISSERGEEVVFDLGNERSFEVLYYPGIHWDSNNTFIISSGNSLDDLKPYHAKAYPGDCFTWIKQNTVADEHSTPMAFSGSPVIHSGRYISIEAEKIGLYIYEIMLVDTETREKITPTLISGNGANLIDEQGVLEAAPTWRNSMYFDEIYHARTGLEQLNSLRHEEPSAIYEVSHPPLGKVFMTLSIAIFGMTPFGWRFPGALAGVLMLPGMYMLGRLFTKRRYLAALPMLLMAFDCMHFAQTRIATIDSFVTLFIIWSTYFMFRYAFLNVYELPFSKSLLPLALSGIFMGLACASKWTGCYAGMGLAVIFFISLYRQIRQGIAAEKALKNGETNPIYESAANTWKNRTVKTLLYCVLFFVIIPLLIYYLSFYPVFVSSVDGLTIEKVHRANISMYNYHSAPGRGADHPFASKWYMWPLSQKPMYYYSAPRIDGTGSAIWAFGNPAVWWVSTVALIAIILYMIVNAVRGKERFSRRAIFILIAYFAQYLPWCLVPRGTYIYHYFPATPFAIMAIAYVIDRIWDYYPKTSRVVAIGITLLSAVLFIGFFPYISGVRVSTAWLDAMRWFPGIYY
ncbi:MAG TPA: phospholipid carrier-dependent glycosyltransferase [Christensenellaceae bacterium]|nr:phospholipid carrier-dependent glycosyltransferase [Christensenellaceae bacterium]